MPANGRRDLIRRLKVNILDGNNDNNYSEPVDDNNGDGDDNDHNKIIIRTTTAQSVKLLSLEPINSDTEKVL